MVYCTKCGSQNKEDSQYCTKCGTSLGEIITDEAWETRFERGVEEFAESVSRGAEDACFGAPSRGSTWSLIIGIIILVWGLVWLLSTYYPWVRWDSAFAILLVAFALWIIYRGLRKRK